MEPQKVVSFELQLCPMNHKNCRGFWNLILMILWDIFTHNSDFLKKNFSQHYFTWRHKVSPLNHFSCTEFNLLRKANFHVTSMNMKFKKIHLRKYRLYVIIQNITEVQNSQVMKSSYETKLCKMTSKFELLTQKY